MANLRKEFSKIYDQHIDKIYRFIFLKVNSQEIAQDLTSETFLRGWETFKERGLQPARHPPTRPEDERAPIENIQAFLYRIARNLVTDHYREKGRARIVSTEFSPIIDPRQNLEEKSMLRSDIDNIRLALVSLGETNQDIIIWHYLDGMSFSEIGRILGKSEDTVRVQTHRALKKLRKKLNHGDENPIQNKPSRKI